MKGLRDPTEGNRYHPPELFGLDERFQKAFNNRFGGKRNALKKSFSTFSQPAQVLF